MENVIIVSADAHAVMPPDMWSHYLETRHNDSLPMLEKETKVFTGSLSLLNDLRLSPAYDIFDKEGLYQSGRWNGLWDADVRLREVDGEGVAAEFVYPGDFCASDLGFSTMNGRYERRSQLAERREGRRPADLCLTRSPLAIPVV